MKMLIDGKTVVPVPDYLTPLPYWNSESVPVSLSHRGEQYPDQYVEQLEPFSSGYRNSFVCTY